MPETPNMTRAAAPTVTSGNPDARSDRGAAGRYVADARALLDAAPADQVRLIAAMTPTELQRVRATLQQLRDGGEPVSRDLTGAVWREWRRKLIADGRDPERLRRDSPDEVERFNAHTIPGLDDCVLWDGPECFRRNGGWRINPQRWAWQHAGRTVRHGAHYRIVATCAAPSCVNIEHLAEARVDRQRYSDERIIGALQAMAMRLGHTPNTRDWTRERGRPTESVISDRFGSWANACRKAGLEPPVAPNLSPIARKVWDEDNVMAAFLAAAREFGFTPSEREWQDARLQPSVRTIRRYYGSWKRIVALAGLPSPRRLIAEHPLRKYARGLRRTPTGSYLADETLDDVQRRLYDEAMA